MAWYLIKHRDNFTFYQGRVERRSEENNSWLHNAASEVHYLQNGSGVYPFSYPVGTGVSFHESSREVVRVWTAFIGSG
jgi:hypothetical protein